METEAPPPKVMMEGWLNKKGGGTGILGSGIGGRSNWNKRWFVLNGPHLDYYESFDPKANDGHGLCFAIAQGSDAHCLSPGFGVLAAPADHPAHGGPRRPARGQRAGANERSNAHAEP